VRAPPSPMMQVSSHHKWRFSPTTGLRSGHEDCGGQSPYLQTTICGCIVRAGRSARAGTAHAGDLWHFRAVPLRVARWFARRLDWGLDRHGHQYLRMWISAPLRSYRTSSISVLIRKIPRPCSEKTFCSSVGEGTFAGSKTHFRDRSRR